jgi:hypothetical protein
MAATCPAQTLEYVPPEPARGSRTYTVSEDGKMQHTATMTDTDRYARCIAVSKRIRWDIDRDVIGGRSFDFGKKFLPDGLSHVDRMTFLDARERGLVSQIQGRTYAYVFGLVERFINAKVLEVSRGHWFGDQVALEALVRFSEEELKHQELFRRIESMIAAAMPPGYQMTADPNAVAQAVLSKSTWAVLALTCHIELFTQVHYSQSIDPDPDLSELYKDVFLYHWREESQHAIIDELEWRREDAQLNDAQRDQAVDDLIALVGAVDGILQVQAAADARYFAEICGRRLTTTESEQLSAALLRAYRWQYIVSGVQVPRFQQILGTLTTETQRQRIGAALAPIMA